MVNFFTLNRKTKIEIKNNDGKPIQNAVKIFYRDLEAATDENIDNKIIVEIKGGGLTDEQFVISAGPVLIQIKAADELGAIYALLFISENYLGVAPFGFWNEKEAVAGKKLIPCGEYRSKPPAVRYRGWFINDEVLLTHWNLKGNNKNTWMRVFETILRCRGNMVIAGTGLEDEEKREWANEAGLWLTHHHATPLGAQMFNHAFPAQKASYSENGELFE